MKITTSRELNENFKIAEVIEKATGQAVVKNKGYIQCPICGGEKGGISEQKNIFSCWNNNCTERKGARPYRFLELYFRAVEGITDFKKLYKRIDSLLGTSLYKEFKPNKTPQKQDKFTRTYKVNKYCSEVEFDFFNDLLKEKRILLKAGTGFGKSHMLAEGVKPLLECGSLDVDKVIFATPRGSIVEEIGERGYETFYKNDVELPYSKLIATTTHKAPLLVQQLDECPINMPDGSIQWQMPKEYLLIIDECHLLLTSRNIVVKENTDLRALKELIDNAKYVIFTSANTDHFFDACKELYNIKSYINIDRNVPLYNLEKLIVKRVNKDRDIRNQILIEDITREKANNNKVFLVHNNIKDLRQIELELNKKGILAKVLYSANKTSDEVIKEYTNLIKKSILSCDVTLCTSVVDTGVNIHENRVTTMLVQDQMSFDDVTTIQTFARVRVKDNSFSGNKGILYLTEIKERQEKHDKLHRIDSYLKTTETIANELSLSFNTHMLNNYDIESYECYKDVWNFLRYNELYASDRQLLYIECDGDYNENPRMAVDKVATYDKARRAYLSSNYFNDTFIKTVCEEISTKEILFIKDLREKEEKEKTEGETFQDVLLKFCDDQDFENIITSRYVLEEKLDKDPFYIEYLKVDHTTKFNKLDKRIKSICNMIARTRVTVDKFEYAKKMIEAYAKFTGKDLLKEIRGIEYPIYNKMYREPDSYLGLGDLLYVELRKGFDRALFNRAKVTDRAIEIFTIQYLIQCQENKYCYDEETKQVVFKKSKRPVNIEKKTAESIELINLVYNMTDKRHLSFL